MSFPTYKLNKEWSELLGNPSKPFSMMVFGDAKAGKSYFCLSLAQYLTSFGNVAYFVVEEGIGETMRRKIETTGADDVFILPSQNIDDIISVLKADKYKIAFIDSVSSAGMKVDDFKNLKATFPKTSFIAILQTTKDNNYRGEKEWKHEVDAICELTKPEPRTSKIICTGRFGGGEKVVKY
jgi:predicted ATP-dependent serine protease